MLKKLTYFEMLIVPHALQCVDGCFFVFYRILFSYLPHLTQSVVLVSVPGRPTPPPQCVDGCFFVFYRILFSYLPHLTQSVVLVSVPGRPPPTPPPPRPPHLSQIFFYQLLASLSKFTY